MDADSPRTDPSPDTPGSSPEGQVELGKVVGVWGVQGFIKVYSYTRVPGDISRYTPWLLHRAGREQTYEVIECRRQGRGLVALLAGIADRDEAEKLVGSKIFVDESHLSPLPDGEYYWHQLIGLNVINREGVPLGMVDHLLETGANDILVIKDNGIERLLPYVPTVVIDADIEAGLLNVDWSPEWDTDGDG